MPPTESPARPDIEAVLDTGGLRPSQSDKAPYYADWRARIWSVKSDSCTTLARAQQEDHSAHSLFHSSINELTEIVTLV
jgi:hypothetical protein